MKAIVNAESGSIYEGYISRAQMKTVSRANVTPESLNSFHGGSQSARSRVGIGGPEGVPVLSYGAGLTEADAKGVSMAELTSYRNAASPSNTVLWQTLSAALITPIGILK